MLGWRYCKGLTKIELLDVKRQASVQEVLASKLFFRAWDPRLITTKVGVQRITRQARKPSRHVCGLQATGRQRQIGWRQCALMRPGNLRCRIAKNPLQLQAKIEAALAVQGIPPTAISLDRSVLPVTMAFNEHGPEIVSVEAKVGQKAVGIRFASSYKNSAANVQVIFHSVFYQNLCRCPVAARAPASGE